MGRGVGVEGWDARGGRWGAGGGGGGMHTGRVRSAPSPRFARRRRAAHQVISGWPTCGAEASGETEEGKAGGQWGVSEG